MDPLGYAAVSSGISAIYQQSAFAGPVLFRYSPSAPWALFRAAFFVDNPLDCCVSFFVLIETSYYRFVVEISPHSGCGIA
jgi:hypothetical protein